jgi:glycosyltransferase involved in cell wall biosynthesis
MSLKPLTRRIVRLNARVSRFVPSRIVCCSRKTLETHVLGGYRSEKMVLIPNGIDTDHFRPDPAARVDVRRELGLPADTRLVGMFARFHPQKDHRTLLAAAALLHRRVPDAHFVLAGKGIDARNLELMDMIEETGTAARLHLLGTRSDMARLQAAMDVCTLSSSEGEAMPLAIGEAMACGVPCVATEGGDTAELLGATGVCVAPGDPRALAEGWQMLLELPAAEGARLGSAARLHIQQRYSLQSAASAYHALYDGLAASGRR